MQPDNEVPRNHLQLIISLGLVGVLVCILGGYIYLGMWSAKQTPVVVEDVPVIEPTTSEESDRTEEILNALEQATSTTPTEDQDAIINALEQAAPIASEERRAAILEALNSSPSAPAESSDNGETQP
jgi:hypothetical protein